MSKIKSAFSGIGELASKTQRSVTTFEEAPLLNSGFLLTIAALCMAIPTFIVCLVLAINNIQIANQAVMNSSANISFLSAGTLYIENVATVIFFIMYLVALVLLVAYKIKQPAKNGGESIKYQLKTWAIAAVLSLAAAPAILFFAENILTIVMAIIVCALLFFFLSSIGNQPEEDGNAHASNAKKASTTEAKTTKAAGSGPEIKKVYASTKVFRASTVFSGKGIFGYNGYPHDAYHICSQSDYDKGKVRIVDRDKGGRDHHPILPGPPSGAKPAMAKDWD